MPILEFLIELAPDLLRFGKSLYDAFDGDVEEARRDIKDRRAEIAKLRHARDRELDERFPPDNEEDPNG